MKELIESLLENNCKVEFAGKEAGMPVRIINRDLLKLDNYDYYVYDSTFEGAYAKAVAKGWVA